MIVLTTTASSLRQAVEQVQSQRQWIGGVELRVDLLDDSEQADFERFPRLLREAGCEGLALICTVRRTRDGGRSELADEQRLDVLHAAAEAGFSFVDLEADLQDTDAHSRVLEAALRSGTRIIRSFHDFNGVPGDLEKVLRGLPRGEHEVAKAAVTPRSATDLLRVVAACRELGPTPHIVLGMGEYGFPTRALPVHLGNLLTFASVPGASAAPGHVSPQLLSERYRVGEQTHATRVFAVIGDPIAHSQSPAYHNGRFAEDGIDAVYVPVLVDDAAPFFELAESLPILGFSVTIPHKQSVIPYLTERGDDVRAAEACNTVVRVSEGWRGVNTDVIGFLAPLDEVLTVSLAGTTVLVLGAGGAARGVIYALLSREAEVLLWNRTASRAHALAGSMQAFARGGAVRVLEEGADELSRVDVVVNATSVGMYGEGDPATWYEFGGHEVVYDIVYTPPETPLIRRAAAAGCRVITGDRMFRAQAAVQYELYRTLATGESASV